MVLDARNPAGWLLVINGLDSSYVDLTDPTRLEFEYLAWMGAVIDVHVVRDRPLRALHLGGGACSLPRYLAATRPESRQLVFEIDADLIDMVTAAFGLDQVPGLVLERSEAGAGLHRLAAESYDVVVRDAFDGGSVPGHLATPGVLTEVARVLADRGVYLANVPAGPDLQAAEAEAAVAGGVFEHVALLVDPGQFHARRFGNTVVAASDAPLDLAALQGRLEGDGAPAYVIPLGAR